MENCNSIMIFVEQNDNRIHRVSYELLNKGKELCEKSNSLLYCLVLGDEGLDAAELSWSR